MIKYSSLRIGDIKTNNLPEIVPAKTLFNTELLTYEAESDKIM